MKIAVVEKNPSRIRYDKHFKFEFDQFSLLDKKMTKILKADITLDFDLLNEYDYVILVGAEPAKFIAQIGSVVKYAGHLVKDKFIPIFSPAMLSFRPEIKPNFEAALTLLHKNIEGEVHQSICKYQPIDNKKEALRYLRKLLEHSCTSVALDTETSAFYPKDGYVLGLSISHKENQGVYISTDCIDDDVERLMQKVWNAKNVVFHNAKFDRKFLEFHFNFTFPSWDCTMLMHYLLDENSPHDLKYLAMRFTDLGEYDKDLDDYKRAYCKQHKIGVTAFTYDLFPWEIISEYAAADTDCTIRLFNIFNPIMEGARTTIGKVYKDILKPGTDFLIDIEMSGVPFDKNRLLLTRDELDEEIYLVETELYTYKEVALVEESLKERFNFGSPKQLSKLLYSVLGLPVLQKTATGAPSTNAEVLEQLGEKHPIAGMILKLRKLKKIKSTYIDKILAGIDQDGRLRTGFHLHTVTSGRLSSSGKLNMQQLPRDDKRVKHCIVAPKGYVIVSQDLATAEMYYAAVLSKDKALQGIFSQEGDFHSLIANMVFRLGLVANEFESVKDQCPKHLRQASKAISFGILYGSGPAKVAEVVNCSVGQAKDYIAQYFQQFPQLKKWLDRQKLLITKNGYTYSHFGRKRRVPEVKSTDQGIAGGGVRSAVNFLIQSVASDCNLLAAVDMNNWLKTSDVDATIFGLVHDSILAFVKIEDLERYNKKLAFFTVKDRGISIKGSPIGLDVEVGETYAFKKAA